MYGPNEPARVEHLPEQRVRAVEEQLRDAPVGERRRQRRPASGCRSSSRGRRGPAPASVSTTVAPASTANPKRQQPVDVLLAGLALVGAHDLRHEDRVEHAAGEEHVEDVGQLVRHRERVGGLPGRADRGGHDHAAQQPEHARDGGARGHEGSAAAHPVVGRSGLLLGGVGPSGAAPPRTGSDVDVPASASVRAPRRALCPRRTVRTIPSTRPMASRTPTTIVPMLSIVGATCAVNRTGGDTARPSVAVSCAATTTVAVGAGVQRDADVGLALRLDRRRASISPTSRHALRGLTASSTVAGTVRSLRTTIGSGLSAAVTTEVADRRDAQAGGARVDVRDRPTTPGRRARRGRRATRRTAVRATSSSTPSSRTAGSLVTPANATARLAGVGQRAHAARRRARRGLTALVGSVPRASGASASRSVAAGARRTQGASAKAVDQRRRRSRRRGPSRARGRSAGAAGRTRSPA